MSAVTKLLWGKKTAQTLKRGIGRFKNSSTAKVEEKTSCKASSLTHSQAKGEEKKFELRKIAQPPLKIKWSIPNRFSVTRRLYLKRVCMFQTVLEMFVFSAFET